MGWQQITMIVMWTLTLAVHLLKNGETTKYSFVVAIFGVGISMFILISGGFFSKGC